MIALGLEGASGQAHETIIVGSGPAGLTLAMELARRGRPALLLEIRSRPRRRGAGSFRRNAGRPRPP